MHYYSFLKRNGFIFYWSIISSHLLPRWHSGKESTCQCRRHKRCGFYPWVRKNPWRRKWQPTPVFLPGKFHGQRSMVGCSPWSRERVGHDLVIKQQQQQQVLFSNSRPLLYYHHFRLYTWTLPDGQHWKQIDYILCSQRQRSSIWSAKTRLGVDCGSDHELLIAKFWFKLKKVGKLTRPLTIQVWPKSHP